MIDVVIPVYRGLAETRTCIESVLAARTRADREVVVIDDASPEPEIRAWLATLAASGRITLVSHAENRGFVATANEGMALHPDRDVVLLNSDTEVAEGWLDRLAAHAGCIPNVGTITPFSNNATVCSYPRTLVTNELPQGETTASLDAAFAAANAGRSVEIPTAVGFCMYIARRCLDRVGAFDEARYGTGYGEEVDFCMRAAREGFRNMLAGDVFVRHVGEVSFGSAGAERRAKAQATVDALYPEFQTRLCEHLTKDPALELRRRADLERLRRSPLPRVLFVAHRYGGGVRRHMEELAAALAGHCEILLLQPHRRSYAVLTWLGREEELALWFHHEQDWERLIETLRGIGVARVHFHHVHGMPMSVLELPRHLAAQHDVTVHDYFAICPRYHLSDAAGHYCGERGEAGCTRCLDAGPIQWPLTIEQWRERFHVLLAGAGRVIAPSADAAERITRHFPDITPVVWPHAHKPATVHPRPHVILVPGGLSPEKGIDVLEACARDARARGLPLHFRVIGFVARPLPPWPELPLTFTGEYVEETLAARIALERGDAVFFPAQVPETFSYTLSAAMDTGLPIVATDLGALPERLADYPRARIVPWKASAQAMNDALMASVDAIAAGSEPSTVEGGASFEDYRARYLGALASAASPAPGTLPDPGDMHLAPPYEPLPEPTLVELFDDGVLCGKSTSLAELRVRAQSAEEERKQHAHRQAQHTEDLALSHSETREATARAEAAQASLEHADARREAAEARVRELEASTSWRLTAPLRALSRLLRGRG